MTQTTKAISKIIDRFNRKATMIEQERLKLNEKKKEIEGKMIENFNLTEVTDLVIRLRKKALDCEEIKNFIKASGQSIEDAALIKDHECPPHSLNSYDVSLTRWTVIRMYFFGGPKSRFKIFFRECYNGQYPLIGFTFDGKFPMRTKQQFKAGIPKKEIGRMFGFRRSLYRKGFERRAA